MILLPKMRLLNPTIVSHDSLTSTNSEAARLALEGALEGLCIVALEQTAGRGRLGRKWSSPAGAGLYFSILLRPSIPIEQWPLLTLMAAVAVHDALIQACDLEADIKWPNDLTFEGKKLCGILAETLETGEGRAVVIGIGLNLLTSAFPEDLLATAISLEEAMGEAPDREAILKSLLQFMTRYYELLHTTGGRQIIDAWCTCSSYASGKQVRVAAADEVFEGVTRGLEGDGALRVETAGGELKVVRAGDVTAVRPV
jgi:BirA family biotin operon repressor/biotin-[acetyl-CoA-carboxylase] ligase